MNKSPKNFPLGKSIFEGAIDGCPFISSMLEPVWCIEGGPIEEDTGIVSMFVLSAVSLFGSEYLELVLSPAIVSSEYVLLLAESSSLIVLSLTLSL